MNKKNYVIGIDYGSDSCRSIIVDANTGKEMGSEVFYYPRWKEKKYCDPEKNIYRQHPLDYIEGLEAVIKKPLSRLPKDIRENIRGISIDTTGSTPVAVDEKGLPLALKAEFQDNPNAMFILWKDHSATKEADLINRISKTWGGIDFKFENTRTYPIKILISVNSGIVKVDIYGIQEEVEYDVSFDTETISNINYDIIYEKDSSLADGEEEIKRAGAKGIIVNTYKVLRKNGVIVSRELISKDTYNAMNRIIVNNTGTSNN